MATKKIIITKDGRKKADVKVGHAGKLTFTKETLVVNVEDDSKGTKGFLIKLKAGNPDAEIIQD